MKSPVIHQAVFLGVVIILCSCGGQEAKPECGDLPITPSPDAIIVKVNGQPLSNPASTDILIQRNATISTNILLDYTVKRTWTKCGGSYTGPLNIYAYNLPQGVTATFDPTVIPVSQGSDQALQLSLEISPQVSDGKIPIELRSHEVFPIIRPIYNIVLTTTP